MKNTMFIYQTSPEDQFTGMMSVAQAIQGLSHDLHAADTLLADLMACAHYISKHPDSRWEGDLQDVFVFSLPGCSAIDTMVGFIWRQSSNGTTFVCSPVRLSWLAGDELLVLHCGNKWHREQPYVMAADSTADKEGVSHV